MFTVDVKQQYNNNLIENSSNIYFYLFSILSYKTEQNRNMSSCYSGDHIAEDHIHMDTTTRNIEEPQQNTALE